MTQTLEKPRTKNQQPIAINSETVFPPIQYGPVLLVSVVAVSLKAGKTPQFASHTARRAALLSEATHKCSWIWRELHSQSQLGIHQAPPLVCQPHWAVTKWQQHKFVRAHWVYAFVLTANSRIHPFSCRILIFSRTMPDHTIKKTKLVMQLYHLGVILVLVEVKNGHWNHIQHALSTPSSSSTNLNCPKHIRPIPDVYVTHPAIPQIQPRKWIFSTLGYEIQQSYVSNYKYESTSVYLCMKICISVYV